MKKRCVLVSLFLAGALQMAMAQTPSSTDIATGWIDVTAPLDVHTTPIFPGDAPLDFAFLKSMDHGDPLTLSKYCLGAHSGTHIDAPMHFIKGGEPTDKIPLSTLMGMVRVINCSPNAVAIDTNELQKHEWQGAKRIFFRTRNSHNHWMTDQNFHKDFSYLAPDAAKLLADGGVELVGIDYISMEQFGASSPDTHRTLLGKGIPIIEGLDLSVVQAGDYEGIVLPMKVVGHEGVPVRALLRKADR